MLTEISLCNTEVKEDKEKLLFTLLGISLWKSSASGGGY